MTVFYLVLPFRNPIVLDAEETDVLLDILNANVDPIYDRYMYYVLYEDTRIYLESRDTMGDLVPYIDELDNKNLFVIHADPIFQIKVRCALYTKGYYEVSFDMSIFGTTIQHLVNNMCLKMKVKSCDHEMACLDKAANSCKILNGHCTPFDLGLPRDGLSFWIVRKNRN